LGAAVKYKTIQNQSDGLFKEKGSKFIAYAVPCYSEEEVRNYLVSWKKDHHQARHVCYAYRLGADKKNFRANDDGEPNNSAGIPILGQIQSFDLTNVLVGVVRYFGGTKLGVGGLVQAYKTAAKEALEHAVVIEKELMEEFELRFQYDQLPSVMNFLKTSGVQLLSTELEAECCLVVECSLLISDKLRKEMEDISVKSNGIR
jgi:uncharacterized YigZ family protein